MVGGLSIGRSPLSLPTMAQRWCWPRSCFGPRRPRSDPTGASWSRGVGSVLEVVYAIFNEATRRLGRRVGPAQAGHEALLLGRILAELAPSRPSARAVALMEFRFPGAGSGGQQGRPVRALRPEQAQWDRLLIRRGHAHWRGQSGRAERSRPIRCSGDSACHCPGARAEVPIGADRRAYDCEPADHSPVVELIGAVAVGMAEGRRPTCPLWTSSGPRGARGYHLLPTVRETCCPPWPRCRGPARVRVRGRSDPHERRGAAARAGYGSTLAGGLWATICGLPRRDLRGVNAWHGLARHPSMHGPMTPRRIHHSSSSCTRVRFQSGHGRRWCRRCARPRELCPAVTRPEADERPRTRSAPRSRAPAWPPPAGRRGDGLNHLVGDLTHRDDVPDPQRVHRVSEASGAASAVW